MQQFLEHVIWVGGAPQHQKKEPLFSDWRSFHFCASEACCDMCLRCGCNGGSGCFIWVDCVQAAKKVMDELENRCPSDARGNIYLQLCTVESCKEIFTFHLEALKAHFKVHKTTMMDTMHPKNIDWIVWYIMNSHKLDCHAYFFKMKMEIKIQMKISDQIQICDINWFLMLLLPNYSKNFSRLSSLWILIVLSLVKDKSNNGVLEN